MTARNLALPLAAIAALAIAAFVILRPHEQPAAQPAPVPAPELAPPADLPLPPAAQSDAQLRADFSQVSPRLAAWLSQPDLLDRVAALAEDLARDESPRQKLDFLAPRTRLRSKDGHIDPASYARFDGAADVVASVDAAKLVAAVRAAHPLLESAYHRIANPNGHFDDAVRAGLQRIVNAPVADTPPAVVPKGANDLFADEKYEVLGPVEKQLLRMGPRNERVLQQKARELLAAFGQ